MKRSVNILHLTMTVALGGLLFGYDTAVISGATGALTAFFQLTPTELGFAACSALIGCFIGAYMAGNLSAYQGRKRALIIAAILFFISAIGTAVPNNYWFFIIFCIVGSVGIASMVSPMYIAEVAPPNNRGRINFGD